MASLVFSNPAKERAGSNDRYHLANGLAQSSAELQEPFALLGQNRNARRELAAEDIIFSLQILDLPGQFFLRGAGDDQEQRAVDRVHGRPERKRLGGQEKTSFLHPGRRANRHSQVVNSGASPLIFGAGPKWPQNATRCNRLQQAARQGK